MSVAERLSDVWNGVTDAIRHRRASEVTEAETHGFEHLRGHKHCLLVTFRRSGEPVPTPVWFGLLDGKVYARSEERVGKVKRIRANPRVLVAPCDNRGKPLGAAAEGRVRIVGPDEEERAEAAIRDNFGVGRKMYEGVAMKLGPAGVLHRGHFGMSRTAHEQRAPREAPWEAEMGGFLPHTGNNPPTTANGAFLAHTATFAPLRPDAPRALPLTDPMLLKHREVSK